MKKFLIILSVIVTLFALASCKTDNNPTQNGDPNCEHVQNSDLIQPGRANPATCTEDGNTADRHCVKCGYIETPAEIVPATGHTEVAIPEKAATCTAKGNTAGSRCSTCNEVIVAVQIKEKLDHKIIDTPSIETTCTVAGSEGGTHCEMCLATMTEPTVTNPFGHDKGLAHITVVKEGSAPSCTSTGLTDELYCTKCNETVLTQQVIPMISHTLEVVAGGEAKEPDCATETDGATAHIKCSAEGCDYEIASETIPYQHTLGEWTVTTEPEVGKEGEKQATCESCEKIVKETIPALTDPAT